MYLCLCVFYVDVFGHRCHDIYVETRGQLEGICGSLELNLDHQV